MFRFLRTSAVALALAFAMASSVLPAQALAPKETVMECDLNGLLKQLAQIKQDGSASSTQGELELRKQILMRSMDCNAREANVLASTVAALEGSSKVSASLKKRYEGALKQAAAYASAQGESAAALQTVSSSKEFALALKAWRTESYNPLAWEASQLIVLDRNVALAASGEERLRQLLVNLSDLNEAEGTEAARADLSQAATLINDAAMKLNDALILLRDTPKQSQEAITSAQKTGLDELSQAYRLLLESNEKLGEISPAN